MTHILDNSLLVFLISFCGMAVSALIGGSLSQGMRQASSEARDAFGVIEAATLTLLGLIVAFTFSMALNRYDQRKNLEEEEANAIGTEYFRAELLPGVDTSRVRELLRSYLHQRILFYTTSDDQELVEINTKTAQLQRELWSAIRPSAMAQPTQIAGLVVQGMNDVFNSQGYTQAAWWNRIPPAAWLLMAAIAVWTNGLVGYGTMGAQAGRRKLLFLPLAVSMAFALIADIDDPRAGGIRVAPLNLLSLAQSLGTQ